MLEDFFSTLRESEANHDRNLLLQRPESYLGHQPD